MQQNCKYLKKVLFGLISPFFSVLTTFYDIFLIIFFENSHHKILSEICDPVHDNGIREIFYEFTFKLVSKWW